MKRRIDWIRELKVGDTVLDCRDRARMIVRIEDESEPENDMLAVFPWVIAVVCLPLAYFCHSAAAGFPTVVVDRIVYFADGASCRATLCLDPVPK